MAQTQSTHSKQSNQEATKEAGNKVGQRPPKSGYASRPKAKALGTLNTADTAKPVTPVSKLKNVAKANLERLAIKDLPKTKPDFSTPGATKDALVTEYLTNYIVNGLNKGNITEQHLLPRKQDIAQHLGVSVGTVQNAIRTIEDYGHVESKQRIGTIIRDASKGINRMRKLTSKRDRAVHAVRNYIVEQNIQPGEPLPSAREIAESIDSATNTTRLALEYLTHEGILFSYGTRGNRANWELKEIPTLDKEATLTVESETLIDQVERDLKDLVAKSYPIGQKLPSHLELADELKVSIKTVHDAMKRLNQQGVVQSKRGRYGTFVKRTPDTAFITGAAASVFVPVDDPLFYSYEKVEGHLKNLIANDYKKGDKLPAMGDLSKELKVSSNTVRKALLRLADDNIVTFARGRYGGTFVNKVPSKKEVANTTSGGTILDSSTAYRS